MVMSREREREQRSFSAFIQSIDHFHRIEEWTISKREGKRKQHQIVISNCIDFTF